MFFKVRNICSFISYHDSFSGYKKKSARAGPRCQVCCLPDKKEQPLQANEADMSMVLITGIAKFHPPAEMPICPINLKGWNGIRQRVEAEGLGVQLNFKQAIACNDTFQDPSKDARYKILPFPSLETILSPVILLESMGEYNCCR